MRLSLPTAIVVVAVAVALPLTVSGCSSDTSSAQSSNASTAPSTSTDPDAGIPTGTQLNKALAPPSYFPAGLAQDLSSTRDTGDTYEPQVVGAPPAKPDCTQLATTGWPTLTGISGVSFAQTRYLDKDTSEELDEEFDAFQGTAAQAELAAIGKVAVTCPGYTDTQTHSQVKVTEQPIAGLGDGGFTITLTDPAWQSGNTIQAVRVGNTISLVYSTTGQDNGAAGATKLSTYLVGQLKSLH